MSENWSLSALEELARDALVRCGTSALNADPVARALVAAEVDGQYGHGLRRLETYCPQVRSGKVAGGATPVLEQTATAAARVDAGAGFAYPALEHACDWLGQTTPDTGIAAAAVHHSHHCGVAGHWVEALAGSGLVALMFANTPSAIAPAGGNAPLFGTNPIAFAAPGAEGAPTVIDLSLSKVARGKIMAAKQKGEPIPQGWAIDAQGHPTTDPDAALSGSMLPIGNAKGAALALMVELLAAGLTGANFAHEASSFFEAEGAPPRTGQLLIAFSPDALGGPGFAARLDRLTAAILDQPGTRMPGANKTTLRTDARRNGIKADPALIETIRRL